MTAALALAVLLAAQSQQLPRPAFETNVKLCARGGCSSWRSTSRAYRVLRETSAHYLLGVEGSEADRDGRPHPIRVHVTRRGAQVRSRTELVIPKG